MMRIYLMCLIVCLLSGRTDVSAREVVTFNDGWEFKKGPFSQEPMKSAQQWNGRWEKVSIPHTWNAEDMQLKTNSFYEGDAYYRKKYLFPETMQGKRIFLRFEGVGACAEIYINEIGRAHV